MKKVNKITGLAVAILGLFFALLWLLKRLSVGIFASLGDWVQLAFIICSFIFFISALLSVFWNKQRERKKTNMSKSMKIARYTITIITSLIFVIYILKIAGVGFFASLGNWVLLPFWVLAAINMILILKLGRKAKNNEDK